MEIDFLCVHLSSLCNLTCLHCVVEAKTDPTLLHQETVSQNIMRFGKTFLETNIVNTVYVDGGEPFMTKELLYRLIEVTRPQVSDLRVTTNGTLIASKDITFLIKNNVGLQFSIDGLEKTHDIIRGKGTYRKAIHSLERCIEKEVDISVICAISRVNYKAIKVFVEDLIRRGVKKFSFFYLSPAGRGRTLSDKVLCASEWKEVLETLSVVQEEYGEIEFYVEPGFLPKTVPVRKLAWYYRCSLHHLKNFYLDISSGKLYTCGLMYGLSLPLGSIFEGKMLENISTITAMGFGRTPLECKKCVHYDICAGGCTYFLLTQSKPDFRCSSETIPVCACCVIPARDLPP